MKFPSVSTFLVAAALVSAQTASALTLSHRTWTADSFNTFSAAGFGSSSAAGIQISGVGNTQQMPDATVTDPETGEAVQVPVFRYPVTKSNVKLLQDGHLARTDIGWTARSGLKFTRGKLALALVNFRTDFVKKILYADIITPTATLKDAPLFTFQLEKTTYADIKNGYIVAKGAINQMVLTPEAIDVIATTLKLSPVLRAPLPTMDWGRVDVDVSNKPRRPITNDKPLTAADVGIIQTTAP
jgi:hypothetical protein